MNHLPKLNAFFEGIQSKPDATTTHLCPKCGKAWREPWGDRCGFCADEKSQNAPMLRQVQQ